MIAVSKANVIDDIAAKIVETVAEIKGADIPKIVKSLSSLSKLNDDHTLPNCIKQHDD